MSTDTKTALLDAAERVARARGFDGFSYADLAADVGIRKASIHHHFPTKAALSEALVARYGATFDALCTEIDASGGSGGARLSALIDTYCDAAKGGTALCLCVAFSISRDTLPAETVARIAAFRTTLSRWIAGCFARAQADGSIQNLRDPDQEGAATLALLEGAQLGARATQDMADFDAALAVLKSRLA